MLELYYIHIASVLPYREKFDLLRDWVSEDAYRMVSSFKNERVRFFRLLGEALVRYVLNERWNISPFSYRILRQDKGKPYLDREGIYFNISHSGDYLICAFSDREVGVDIEKRKEARMTVASRFFHPFEIEILNACEREERDRLFYDLWAIKESFLKYKGTGLMRPLSSFQVSIEKDEVILYEDDRKLPLCVKACDVDDGYACYVCGECGLEPKIQPILLENLGIMK